jgi:hypothetical protein
MSLHYDFLNRDAFEYGRRQKARVDELELEVARLNAELALKVSDEEDWKRMQEFAVAFLLATANVLNAFEKMGAPPELLLEVKAFVAEFSEVVGKGQAAFEAQKEDG